MIHKNITYKGTGKIFINYKSYYNKELFEDLKKVEKTNDISIIHQIASVCYWHDTLGQTEASIKNYNEKENVLHFASDVEFIKKLLTEIFGDVIDTMPDGADQTKK